MSFGDFQLHVLSAEQLDDGLRFIGAEHFQCSLNGLHFPVPESVDPGFRDDVALVGVGGFDAVRLALVRHAFIIARIRPSAKDVFGYSSPLLHSLHTSFSLLTSLPHPPKHFVSTLLSSSLLLNGFPPSCVSRETSEYRRHAFHLDIDRRLPCPESAFLLGSKVPNHRTHMC